METSQDLLRGEKMRGVVPTKRWTRVVYDVTGIDADIERLLAVLQKKHGYTRAKANAELLRRLAFATV